MPVINKKYQEHSDFSETEIFEKIKAMSPADFMNALSTMVKYSANMFWDKGGLCIKPQL